ncbi:MAG TPA: hypothetical protein VMH80_18355 [Bryobacteraceae bacterium]|nr:hypothetical protein [Bryobacteraceae bacterium]
MAHPRTVILSIGVGLLTVYAGPAGQAPVEMRKLYVNVEKDGAPIGGLGAENFHLYVNGQPHSFELEKPGAASIALALEYSTTSWRQFQELNAPIRAFLERAPKDDSYALAVYSRPLMVAFEFTRQANVLPEVYAALGSPVWSEINTYDAVYGMLERLGQIPGRRILVLIGSGADTLSGHSLEDVQRKIETENVTVFVIGTGPLFREAYAGALGPRAAPRFAGAQSFLQVLATESGGGAWFPSQAAEVPAILDRILGRIADEYCLVYQSSQPRAGTFESVKVTMAGPSNQESYKVLVRQGWR